MKYLILALVLTLAACNTFHGMGEDVQNLGNNIQKAAS